MKRNPSILVVDDEQASTTLVTELLRHAGYTVSVATDGFKAIASCKVRAPDLILLDIHMPIMSGLDVYYRLRAEERTRDIPVIFLSGRGDVPFHTNADEMADQEFLIKPPEPTELITRVKTALRVKALKDEIRRKEGQLMELSLVDPLTSFRNGRYLKEFLRAEIIQSRRYNVALSLLVVDLDKQMELLRVHGQAAMDHLLTQIAAIISKHCRQSDIPARLGGFEFSLVLPHTSREGAAEVAERIRAAVAESQFSYGGFSLPLYTSIGVCQFSPDMDDEGELLLSITRQAVAQAQAKGGNMTLLA